MGNICGCCGKSEEHTVLTPDPVNIYKSIVDIPYCENNFLLFSPPTKKEQRRRLQQEAAERRVQETAARGIKNPASVARNQKKAEELSKASDAMDRQGGPTLRVIHYFWLFRIS